MANLVALPYDVLLLIVAKVLPLYESNSPITHFNQPRLKFLWPLSLTCHLLHSVCSNWLFSSYRLLFRVSALRAKYNPPPTLDDDNGQACLTLTEWEEAAMLTRVAHFASKARFARELCIEDYGQSEDLPAFPPSFQVHLAELLKGLGGRLQTVYFKGDGFPGRLHSTLWATLRKLAIRTMSLEGVLPPLGGAERMDCVETLHLEWCEDNAAFLQLCNPTELELRYTYPHSNPTEDPPLLKLDFDSLQRATITYLLSNEQITRGGVLFDMSKIPLDASFEIVFKVPCHFKFQLPVVLQNTQLMVAKAFTEDPGCYNLFLSPGCDIVVVRGDANTREKLEMGFQALCWASESSPATVEDTPKYEV
ncbi:hypothetical protein BDY19DRAFT_995582 [Irpex rosettiformis]|uniref:Uncharacterized protein n=1 Tax=Irpex rosettiformis TaxID=378272 RepID=A0ACB8TXW9_9APHY|nr:hypothetical protein BDY19DRAFT_995582 [Irpex rosettiformis]